MGFPIIRNVLEWGRQLTSKNKAAHEALVSGRYAEAAALYRQMIACCPMSLGCA
jgi:hypothetical protein